MREPYMRYQLCWYTLCVCAQFPFRSTGPSAEGTSIFVSCVGSHSHNDIPSKNTYRIRGIVQNGGPVPVPYRQTPAPGN